jgi:DNA-binding IclR family transcriptional regulator
MNASDSGSTTAGAVPRESPARAWTFLTNHAHVLVCLATDPDMRLRDLAVVVGITERAAQRILLDLVQAGYVSRIRVGRRNSYGLRLERPMRHPVEAGHTVRDLVAALVDDVPTATRDAGRRAPR